MLKRVAAAALVALLPAGLALAEPAVFTWTGYGLNVPGSGKCPTYKMTIDVHVGDVIVATDGGHAGGKRRRVFFQPLDQVAAILYR